MDRIRLSVSLVKRKREREEGNSGNNRTDERSYENHDKMMRDIRGYFWDRFILPIFKLQGSHEFKPYFYNEYNSNLKGWCTVCK